uniref:NADH-ubiquinone oxidoreductase chain 2 n=1 Tax=Suragina sp. KW-2016 TaxID=1812714 RepID=A0A164R3R5_9DIPT|nr:NADH dehydrogenase subunit 2 [Suragina sp. KW-2016]
MLNNSSKMLFMSTLMIGSMIAISANSWLTAWMGLEINLLSFIPLMNNNSNMMPTEASLKYFLTQSLASMILLFAIIISMMKFNFTFQFYFNNLSNLMIMSTLLLKMGAAPFHFWFPNVMEGLSWNNNFILMTWQKIAPMMLISYFNLHNFMMTIILFSIIIGSLGGLNQTSLRKIMAFSSINHLGWMLCSMNFSENMWFTYFLFYSFISLNIIMFFNMFQIFHMNQLFSIFFNSKITKFLMFMNLLSLGGLPPFLGFIPKWLVIQYLSINKQFMLLTLMTCMTLITLYFYLRICYSAFMLNYNENNWIINMTYNSIFMNLYLIMSTISLTGMFSISMIFYFI